MRIAPINGPWCSNSFNVFAKPRPCIKLHVLLMNVYNLSPGCLGLCSLKAAERKCGKECYEIVRRKGISILQLGWRDLFGQGYGRDLYSLPCRVPHGQQPCPLLFVQKITGNLDLFP